MTIKQAQKLAERRSKRQNEEQFVVFDPVVEDLPLSQCYWVASEYELNTHFHYLNDADIIECYPT